MVDDKILIARENRRELIKKLAQDSDLVCIKANVPGWDKNIPQANAVIYTFALELRKLGAFDFNFYQSADGLAVFCKINDGGSAKQKTVELEKTHLLGRLVDVDVFLKGQEKSLSRANMRKCFLCENPAFVCGRNKTHSTAELLGYFIKTSDEYFAKIIEQIIEDSMLSELNIENKFGLVTPSSNGSHKDLSYGLMRNAISAIKRPLTKAFLLGLTVNNSPQLVQNLKDVGFECERQMFNATNGANAYKGFIFVGGIVLATVGMLIKNTQNIASFNQTCRDLCKQFSFPNDTFGAKAFKDGVGGIRECALDGFSIVERAQALLNSNSLIEILAFIVGNISDTVLYKRAGNLDRYNYFKQLIFTEGGKNSQREIITKECIENNISIGGSADILISAVMLDKLKDTFYL